MGIKEKLKNNKLDIGKLAIFVMMVIMIFQLGQWNGQNIEKSIKEYCMPNVNYTIGWTGTEVVLWKNKPLDILVNNTNITIQDVHPYG